MNDLVLVERREPIVTVTLNHPARRNSLSDEMLTALGRALSDLRDDAATRAVILTGSPPIFSAGADAPFRKGMSEAERRAMFLSSKSQFRRLFERANTLLEGLEQVTVCAINGHAVGGGWGMTLACDFRLAAAGAEFWIPEVDLGVPLGVGSTARFVRLVGPALAKEIILTCRRYSAAEAHALGLVHRVVPDGDLARAAFEYARMLAAKPFRALAECKARINTIARIGIPDANAMTEGFLERS
jgi:enoyl-CoA hydratase/carnithine racemase